MPSPDVTTYVDLELVDVDEQDLIDTALADAAVKWPDWEPREGNTEVLLIELLAGIVAEDVYTLNQLPAGITEILLRLFGLTRDPGSPPSADVLFTIAGTTGATIPAGSTVRLNLGEDLDPLDLVTASDLVIDAGATSGTVTANATDVIVGVNGTPAGTALEVLDAVPSVNSATLATAVAGGREEEDGTAFLDRAVARLSRLTTTLVRPDDFVSYVVEAFPDVYRVQVLDLWNPTGGHSPGNDPGYVTVAVASQGGGNLTSTRRLEIATDLRTHAHAGLIINVVNANITRVNVTVTVLRFANADELEVEANVRAALADYLNPDTWAWSPLIRRNEIIGRVDAAQGVDVVLDVTAPSADLALSGAAPIAALGDVNVTVQAP